METTELTEKLFFELLREIPKNANKGTLGTLTVVAGSECFRGAASLCTGAALRTGAGIVRLVSVEKAVECTAARHPTCTFIPVLAEKNGMISYDDFTLKLKLLSSSSALLCGCGLGQSEDTRRIVAELLTLGKPTVLDADALNVISHEPSVLTNTSSAVIITPHIGEMSRLSGKTIPEIKTDRAACAKAFTDRYGCVTVLKDDITFIASPDGNVYEGRLGNQGLAKGGSGDVLAGFIGGFLAQGYMPTESAVLGNILHGLCASLCAAEKGFRAMLPDELENYVCRVLA